MTTSRAETGAERRSGAFRALHRAAWELVSPWCDIEERLELIPATARLRGILFRSVVEQVEIHGALPRYRELFPDDRFSSIPFYPLAEYLLRVAVGGALVASPERLHDGMHEISRGNAKAFAGSLLGRVMIRLLARDPVRLTEQGVAARRQMSSYGRWSIVRHDERSIEVVYEEEYAWIESAIAGSAVGTFEARGIAASIETRLKDRFNGSTFIRW